MWAAILFMVRLRIRIMTAYRGAFFVNRLAQILAYAAAYAAIWVMVHRFDTLAGWRWPELALLLSFQLLAYALGASVTFTQMRDLEDKIRLGSLDLLLIKPISPWVVLVFSGLNLGYLGHIALAVGMLAWSLAVLPLHWTPLLALYALTSLISSALVVAALLTMIGACALLLTRSRYLYTSFFGFVELTRYPLSIFPAPLQWLMLTAVPMGFMNYVPVCHLLGKEPAVVGQLGGALAPLSGPLLVLIAMAYWRLCLRQYQGAGG